MTVYSLSLPSRERKKEERIQNFILFLPPGPTAIPAAGGGREEGKEELLRKKKSLVPSYRYTIRREKREKEEKDGNGWETRFFFPSG